MPLHHVWGRWFVILFNCRGETSNDKWKKPLTWTYFFTITCPPGKNRQTEKETTSSINCRTTNWHFGLSITGCISFCKDCSNLAIASCWLPAWIQLTICCATPSQGVTWSTYTTRVYWCEKCRTNRIILQHVLGGGSSFEATHCSSAFCRKRNLHDHNKEQRHHQTLSSLTASLYSNRKASVNKLASILK